MAVPLPPAPAEPRAPAAAGEPAASLGVIGAEPPLLPASAFAIEGESAPAVALADESGLVPATGAFAAGVFGPTRPGSFVDVDGRIVTGFDCCSAASPQLTAKKSVTFAKTLLATL